MNLLNRDFRQMKIAGQHTPFWGGQDGRFLHVNGYSIEQNVPNPFSDRTSIRFQLAPGVESATLSIFNLNGAFVRDYQLNGNAGEVEILAAEIGKGMYIYSLNQNGQEIISKRMIIK